MIKIGDFGLVTAAEEKCVDEGYVSGSLSGTKHTNQVGTTLYMSPEQVILRKMASPASERNVLLKSLNALMF